MHPDEYYSRRSKRYQESIAVVTFAALAVIVMVFFFSACFHMINIKFGAHFSDYIELVKHGWAWAKHAVGW